MRRAYHAAPAKIPRVRKADPVRHRRAAARSRRRRLRGGGSAVSGPTRSRERGRPPARECVLLRRQARQTAVSATALHAVVMGVSGSGKSTVGELLALRLNCRFIDADVLHPRSNVAKMEAGTPLNDADRQPWLELVGQKLVEAGDQSVVVACSALKKSYRDIIRSRDQKARFILLQGSYELLA